MTSFSLFDKDCPDMETAVWNDDVTAEQLPAGKATAANTPATFFHALVRRIEREIGRASRWIAPEIPCHFYQFQCALLGAIETIQIRFILFICTLVITHVGLASFHRKLFWLYVLQFSLKKKTLEPDIREWDFETASILAPTVRSKPIV